MKRTHFNFRCEWGTLLKEYPAKVQLEVYDAVVNYIFTGEILPLSPEAKEIFSMIRKEIDEDQSNSPHIHSCKAD